MTHPLHNRSFLKELDFTAEEWNSLLQLAAQLKEDKKAGREVKRLTGKNIALIFEKTSTRTRCSFEVAAYDQGAQVTYLDPSGSQMGHKESVADTARVLGRFYDGIEFRGKKQEHVEALAELSGVPVWNGLTDEWHPTQMLADQLTMLEHTDKPIEKISFAYLGDARNNVANSLLISAALMGMDVRMVAPKELQTSAEVVAQAEKLAQKSGARILITDDTAEGVKGVDFLYTDVWVSMGEPKEVWDQRIALLRPYQVNAELVQAINGYGNHAVGISGADGRTLRACQLDPELGRVGRVTEVNPDLALKVLDDGYIPVIAGVGFGEDGGPYNVNADFAASHIAQALGADKLFFLTDVDGLYADFDDKDSLIAGMGVGEARHLIDAGTLSKGMIPKVRSAIEAIEAGVGQVTILNGTVEHALLVETFTDEGIGTEISKDSRNPKEA